eukprot:SAG11_NODE_31395_length_292_cov_0.797927_1_plen_88_part_10
MMQFYNFVLPKCTVRIVTFGVTANCHIIVTDSDSVRVTGECECQCTCTRDEGRAPKVRIGALMVHGSRRDPQVSNCNRVQLYSCTAVP